MYVCVYVCMNVFVCILCMYVCIFVCMDVCMYVCMYICLYANNIGFSPIELYKECAPSSFHECNNWSNAIHLLLYDSSIGSWSKHTYSYY